MASAVMRAVRARENAKMPLSAADDATMRSYVPPMRGAMPPGVFHRASTVPRHSNLGMRQFIRGEGLRKAVPRVIPSQLGESEPEEEDTDTMSDDKFEAMQKLTMLDLAPSMGGRPGLVTDEKGQGRIKGRALPSAGTKRELLFDIQRGRYRGDGSRANFDHTVDHINRVTAAKKLGFKRFLMNGSEGADGAQLDAATRELASNSEEVEQIAQVRFAATKLGSLPAIGKIARTVHRRSRAAIRADPAPPPSSYSRFSTMVLLIAFTWGPSFAFGILTFGMPPFVLGIVVLVMACVMLQATARGLLPLVFALISRHCQKGRSSAVRTLRNLRRCGRSVMQQNDYLRCRRLWKQLQAAKVACSQCCASSRVSVSQCFALDVVVPLSSREFAPY